jgi:hypothetical protein
MATYSLWTLSWSKLSEFPEFTFRYALIELRVSDRICCAVK